MVKSVSTKHKRFVLLDANIIAGYYLPDSLSSIRARSPIKNIIDSVRNGASPDLFLYIPNFCIPEVLAVFARYVFATWDSTVKKRIPKKLKKSDYDKLISQFICDLKNGIILNEVNLSSHHIFATNLISLVDANYEYYRNRHKVKVKRNKKMMGAADHAIIGMGIHLSRIHGKSNFGILTADHRLADILKRATAVKMNTAQKLGLLETARELGLVYSKEIYPRVINLATATKNELGDFFGVWPLPTEIIITKPMLKIHADDCKLLAKLREESGIGRDSLPYTEDFEKICRKFECIKGQLVDRNAAWKAIGRFEKKGKKKVSKRIKHTNEKTLF